MPAHTRPPSRKIFLISLAGFIASDPTLDHLMLHATDTRSSAAPEHRHGSSFMHAWSSSSNERRGGIDILYRQDT